MGTPEQIVKYVALQDKYNNSLILKWPQPSQSEGEGLSSALVPIWG